MKHVWLDFRHDAARPVRLLRAAMLAGGILAIAGAGLWANRLNTEKTALEWQRQGMARLEARRLPMFRTASDPAAADAAKRANEVLRELNQPWNELFAALEQAMVPGVSILSVAPDPRKSVVVVRALAPDTEAALDFVERADAGKQLAEAHLVSQELLPENARQPLLFTVSALWRTQP